jgi:hypothetical protein
VVGRSLPNHRPLESNSRSCTDRMCPFNVRSRSPVSQSQSLIVASSDAEASKEYNGWNATLVTYEIGTGVGERNRLGICRMHVDQRVNWVQLRPHRNERLAQSGSHITNETNNINTIGHHPLKVWQGLGWNTNSFVVCGRRWSVICLV